MPLPPHAVAPYLDALHAYAVRDAVRFHVPGHKGGDGADPGLVQAIGDKALEMDIPALVEGIDAGPEPTPFQQAQALAAEAWGAQRTWFITGGATQCNHVACMALAHLGRDVVVQRNCHSSTIFMHAPAVGRILAEAILDGREDEALRVLDSRRFAEGRLLPEPQIV